MFACRLKCCRGAVPSTFSLGIFGAVAVALDRAIQEPVPERLDLLEGAARVGLALVVGRLAEREEGLHRLVEVTGRERDVGTTAVGEVVRVAVPHRLGPRAREA